MFSSFTLVIFSKPNMFYLIRDRNLFNKIAWIKLIQQNVCFGIMVLGISYSISYNIESVNFIKTLSFLLLIPCTLNWKYYIYNKKNYNKIKILSILFLSIQLLYPNIFFITIEYFIIIKMVGNVFDDLDLEKLIPICECAYDYGRIIKTNSATKLNTSKIPLSKNIVEYNNQINKNIFFKFKKSLSFFIKDCKSIKNRPISMNIILIILIIGGVVLNNSFKEYTFIFFIPLYLIINIQLKNILSHNYYILFNKTPLCSSIQTFINQTSYFSFLIYLIINIIFFISSYSMFFIFFISMSMALTSNYNELKNKKISIFNLYNILLILLDTLINNYIMIFFQL